MRYLLSPVLGLLLVVSCGRAAAAKPCATCHPAETQAYSATRMASAMLPVLDSAFARNIESLSLREPGGGYQFTFKRSASDLTVTSSKNGETASADIQWVLGSGAQGQTPIVHATGTSSGDQFFESRVSFFPQLGKYGITVGQTAAPSVNAVASLGRSKTVADLSGCFGCHSSVLDTAAQKVLPGVQCEQCHPGAQAHSAGKATPVNPAKLSARDQVNFCANCHRITPPVNEAQPENIRFQPLRLIKSNCFQTGKLACTTCHEAHQDARRLASTFYNAKCAVCHFGTALHTDARAHGDCIGCHMPQIQLHPALRFTDHFIHVVKSTDYPPGSIVARANGEPK